MLVLGLPVRSASVLKKPGAQIKDLDVQFPGAERISNLKWPLL